jgi:lipopolysaccharide cholinephosphotransferase
MTLQEIQNIELKLLANFDSFCQKNGLKYSLAYGTALGAIRHNGFIPWDDDVDVIMPRDDFEILIKTFSNSYDSYLCVPCSKGFYYPFAKLINPLFPIKEYGRRENIAGLWIDIFPIDSISSKTNLSLFEKKLLKFNSLFWYYGTTSAADEGCNAFKRFLKKIFRFVCHRCPFSKLYSRYLAFLNKNKGDSYFSINGYSVYNVKNAVEINPFLKLQNVNFSGHHFLITGQSDLYLKALYGDYHKFPSLDQRVSHHSFYFLKSK